MKQLPLVFFILITQAVFGQRSEYEKIYQIVDSIGSNIKVHGPHSDGFLLDSITRLEIGSKSITYFKVNDSTYCKEIDIGYKEPIEATIHQWYVFQNEPIYFLEKKYIDHELIYFIAYYISDLQIIGISCEGQIAGSYIQILDNIVKNGIIKKNCYNIGYVTCLFRCIWRRVLYYKLWLFKKLNCHFYRHVT